MDKPSVVIAIVLTFLLMGMASGFASSVLRYTYNSATKTSGHSYNPYFLTLMIASILAIIVIDFFTIYALMTNKAKRARLADGLMKIYQEEGVSQYYDGSSLKISETRYNLYAIVLATLGVMGVITPLLVFINRITSHF